MSVADYKRARGILPCSKVNESVPKEVDTNRVELVDITEKDRPYSDQPLVTLTSSYLQAKDNLGKFDDYALLLRRKVNRHGEELATTLEIRSPIIRKAMKDILSNYSYMNLAACPIQVKKLYNALFHYRAKLREYAKASERTDEEKLHMDVLVKFMDLNLGPIERLYSQLVPNGMTTFETLWTLFRAEEVAVVQTDYYKQCYRIISCHEVKVEGELLFQLDMWSWGYNGTKFGPVLDHVQIGEFQGARRISQLPIIPLPKLPADEQNAYRKAFVGRGRTWKSLVDVSHRQYEGPIWTDPPMERAKTFPDLVMSYVKGRIILDHSSHQRDNYYLATKLVPSGGPTTTKAGSTRSVYDSLSGLLGLADKSSNTISKDQKGSLLDMRCHVNDENYEMTDEEAFLCPARVRGFSLSNKRWALFLVDKIEGIKWKEDAFNQLEFEPTMKSTIRALVESHQPEDTLFDDFIANKGKGVIMLLHGPPGSGKTLTAESIAEFTHKPLYYVGAGELGTQVSASENILKRIFDLAKEWNAILLLDEADCFLSKRSTDDMERNAFVTIFLRLLEYYQGILFLTTNRIEEFDSAFASRIHLKVEYNELDATQRARIWQNLLRPLPACETWPQAVFERLGQDIPINGREIKNLIRITLAVTGHEGKLLSEDSLRTVYKLDPKRSFESVKRST